MSLPGSDNSLASIAWGVIHIISVPVSCFTQLLYSVACSWWRREPYAFNETYPDPCVA